MHLRVSPYLQAITPPQNAISKFVNVTKRSIIGVFGLNKRLIISGCLKCIRKIYIFVNELFEPTTKPEKTLYIQSSMNAKSFYDKYGWRIANAQKRACQSPTITTWPFVVSRLNGGNFPIPDRDLQDVFVSSGINYGGMLYGVFYYPGKITYMPLPNGQCPVISFEFSGCWMAKLCFCGVWYGFHISTSDSELYDCKSQWMSFLERYKNNISDVKIMFQPTENNKDLLDKADILHDKRTPGYSRPTMVAGLITEDNSCFAFIYDYMSAHVVSSPDGSDYIRYCQQLQL